METWRTPDKGKKEVETEPFKETVHNLPIRYDRNQGGTDEGKPCVRSFLRSTELSMKSNAVKKSDV